MSMSQIQCLIQLLFLLQILTVVCLLLWHREVGTDNPIVHTGDLHHHWLGIIATGAYCIILPAIILTYVLGEGAHIKLVN